MKHLLIKKRIVLGFVATMLFFLSHHTCLGQQKNNTVQKKSFLELNAGVAIFDNFVFPGASVLYGTTYTFKNNFVFELEAGFAFPTIGTAKMGIGKKTKNNNTFIAGIRPWPFSYFLQSSMINGEKGDLIISIEVILEETTKRIPVFPQICLS